MTNYPTVLDTNDTLHLVHDNLRVKLLKDYSPGDTSITVDDTLTLLKFPPTGIITLTEQCNFDTTLRALSFSYTIRTLSGFAGMVLLDGFTDTFKPKILTDVTMNIVEKHHNDLKDALIEIENFVGKRGEVALIGLTGTMEARINYLRNLVLKPKAWFSVSNRVGISPLTIDVVDLSLRAPNTYIYDFGDGDIQTLTFPFVPGQAEGTAIIPPTPGNIQKIYTTPGIYDLKLTVINQYGTDTIIFPKYIQVRTVAPNPATIIFNPSPAQLVNGNIIRTVINLPVDVTTVTTGEQPLDPIISYAWNLSDGINHSNGNSAEGLWTIGGIYDIILRANTSLGAYRITTFPNVVDVIENTNLWIGIFDPLAPSSAVTKNLYIYEFGLLSEMFKTKTLNPLSISRDPSFLETQPNAGQQIKEFLRNNGFTPNTFVTSGQQGSATLYWSEGGTDYTTPQIINFAEYNGFTDTYSLSLSNNLSRSWNWVSLNSPGSVYFLFGTQPGTPQDITDTDVQVLNLETLTSDSFSTLTYTNGAAELTSNVDTGVYFSVYRSCWQNSTGFIARNDGNGQFFRIKSFYCTLGSPINQITKLPDIPGSTRLEGQIVPMSRGIFFFDNSGEVAVYNTVTKLWSTGGPGVGSPAFNNLQDTTKIGFENESNSLIATSDGNQTAYLSYDYSTSVFLKFNGIDLTFSRLPDRPAGEQFNTAVY